MSTSPPETEAGSYADIQGQVNEHFAGNWEKFLLAVENPAEILHFVYRGYCKGDRTKFEGWSKRQGLPDDWASRFYMTLDADGELKPKDAW